MVNMIFDIIIIKVNNYNTFSLIVHILHYILFIKISDWIRFYLFSRALLSNLKKNLLSCWRMHGDGMKRSFYVFEKLKHDNVFIYY